MFSLSASGLSWIRGEAKSISCKREATGGERRGYGAPRRPSAPYRPGCPRALSAVAQRHEPLGKPGSGMLTLQVSRLRSWKEEMSRGTLSSLVTQQALGDLEWRRCDTLPSESPGLPRHDPVAGPGEF